MTVTGEWIPSSYCNPQGWGFLIIFSLPALLRKGSEKTACWSLATYWCEITTAARVNKLVDLIFALFSWSTFLWVICPCLIVRGMHLSTDSLASIYTVVSWFAVLMSRKSRRTDRVWLQYWIIVTETLHKVGLVLSDISRLGVMPSELSLFLSGRCQWNWTFPQC